MNLFCSSQRATAMTALHTTWQHCTALFDTVQHCSTLFQHCTEHKQCTIENSAFSQVPQPTSNQVGEPVCMHWTAQPCAHSAPQRTWQQCTVCTVHRDSVQRHKSNTCKTQFSMENAMDAQKAKHTCAKVTAKATLALKQRWSNTTPCTSHPSMHNWPTGWVTPTLNVDIALGEQFQFKPDIFVTTYICGCHHHPGIRRQQSAPQIHRPSN